LSFTTTFCFALTTHIFNRLTLLAGFLAKFHVEEFIKGLAKNQQSETNRTPNSLSTFLFSVAYKNLPAALTLWPTACLNLCRTWK
jgi:hypothetical protein